MAKVLVTGGAGYIGSHTVLALVESGYEVVVYDNLSTGLARSVLPPARLVVGDLADTRLLGELMAAEGFSAVLHFAGSIVVPESVTHPLKYYLNNTNKTTSLIHLAISHAIPHFIFSSTAAVYGMPDTSLIDESAPTAPINPYGRTKLMSEWVLEDAGAAHPDFSFIILRYFNVAGADPLGRVGQSTPDATHLIKVAAQAALGLRPELRIFGTDYPTPDGTCIRDYIHVTDLAAAHVLALGHLERGQGSGIFNCGYGHGYSVREIIQAMQVHCAVDFPVIEAERRAGDPPALVADSARIKAVMGWEPQYNDLALITRSAYDWEQKLALR
ncbi:MAG: UDP-glucose 4-epimerase GalE [Desulfovibrionales bacterium]|nr:UDP-glucose 4-epimerase GalE [Desulfovibrionales bacterium]